MWFLFFLIMALFHAAETDGQTFRVATWNVENAFDTVHEKGKEDWEYLPGAERKWNSRRYWKKLKGITQTLAAMELPALIGMQEVENDTVLRDLTRRTALWPARYRYVITDGPDSRGVDVALMYDPKVFRLLSWRQVSVPSASMGLPPTRDMLVASGIIGEDTIHVCVVHLPSRRNNNATTRKNRSLAVETLCCILDSVNGRRCIVMGDFNAEPGDELFESLSSRLATLLPTDRKTLYGKRGTYYFRGEWGFLDHILVTPDMLIHSAGQAEECRFPWLLRTNRQIPHRTYGGSSYIGGTSDHLPLVCDFEMKRDNGRGKDYP